MLTDLYEKKHITFVEADGYLMQCKSDTEHSYRSFLYHFYTALSSNLSKRPITVNILMAKIRQVPKNYHE